MMKSTVSTAVP